MAKRMMVDFHRHRFPQFVAEEEDGMAKPCAVGIEWVNPDTLRTIGKLGIKRTGPRGEPLAAPKREGSGGRHE
jgi:hypothetical protein